MIGRSEPSAETAFFKATLAGSIRKAKKKRLVLVLRIRMKAIKFIKINKVYIPKRFFNK